MPHDSLRTLVNYEMSATVTDYIGDSGRYALSVGVYALSLTDALLPRSVVFARWYPYVWIAVQ